MPRQQDIQHRIIIKIILGKTQAWVKTKLKDAVALADVSNMAKADGIRWFNGCVIGWTPRLYAQSRGRANICVKGLIREFPPSSFMPKVT